MSRRAVALVCIFLTTAFTAQTASDPVSNYLQHRFSAPPTRVTDVQGLRERIHDGRLILHVRDFLELYLLNSTDVRLTRLDTFTAANQISAAKAPFDPAITAQFNAVRSVSPLFFQSGGSTFPIGSTGGGAESNGGRRWRGRNGSFHGRHY